MTAATVPATKVYWRPGCGFCAGLFRSLDSYEIAYEREDIWESDEAAAFVRSVARGNETVPTVVVGDTALVNPTVHDIVALLQEHAPDQVPADYTAPEPGFVARAIGKMLGD